MQLFNFAGGPRRRFQIDRGAGPIIKALALSAAMSLFAFPSVSHGKPANSAQTRALFGAWLPNFIYTKDTGLQGDQFNPSVLTVFDDQTLFVSPASCTSCNAQFAQFVIDYDKEKARKSSFYHKSEERPFIHIILGADHDSVRYSARITEFGIKIQPGENDLATGLVNLGIGLQMPCVLYNLGAVDHAAPLEQESCAPTFKQAWEASDKPAFGPAMLARLSGKPFEPRRGRTETLRQVAEDWRVDDLPASRDDAPDKVTISPAFAAALRAAYRSDREYRVVAKFAPRPDDFVIDAVYPSDEASTDTCYNLSKNPASCFAEALNIHTHLAGAADMFSDLDIASSGSEAKPMLMVNEKGVYLGLPTEDYTSWGPRMSGHPGNRVLSMVLNVAIARNEAQLAIRMFASKIGVIIYRLNGTVFEKMSQPTITELPSPKSRPDYFDDLPEVQKEWILWLVAIHNAACQVQDLDAWLADPTTVQRVMNTTTVVGCGDSNRGEAPINSSPASAIVDAAGTLDMLNYHEIWEIVLPSPDKSDERRDIYFYHKGGYAYIYEIWYHGFFRYRARRIAEAKNCDYLGAKICDYFPALGAVHSISNSQVSNSSQMGPAPAPQP